MSDSPVLLKVCKTMGQMGQMQKIITNTIIKIFPILTFDPNNSTVDHFCYQFPYAIKLKPQNNFATSIVRRKLASGFWLTHRHKSVNIQSVLTIPNLKPWLLMITTPRMTTVLEIRHFLKNPHNPWKRRVAVYEGKDAISGKRVHQLQQSRGGLHQIWSKLQVVRKMFW